MNDSRQEQNDYSHMVSPRTEEIVSNEDENIQSGEQETNNVQVFTQRNETLDIDDNPRPEDQDELREVNKTESHFDASNR